MIKKVLLTVAVVIAVAVAGILLYATTRPDSFRVERSADIKAPPEKIYPILADLHRNVEWSPWEKKDPAMKRTYGGAPSGVGATYEWAGNSDIGSGRIEIVEASPSKVAMKLDFLEPFEAHNIADFTLVPAGETTRVTWSIHGPMPYVSKVITMFCDMDQMIGKEFETGLASLKAITEK
jgi:hypothetical protein